jgi:preprotein translocase subunit SecF
MELFRSTSRIRFVAKRRVFYVISAVLMLASLASLFTRGLNLSVDFTGGVTVEASFPGEAPIDRVRTGLEGAGFVDPQVQNFGSSRDLAIRLPPRDGESAEATRGRVETALLAVDPGVVLQKVDVVGPQVGGELFTAGWQSLLATIVLIFIYVFIRFNTIKLSTGAIVAAMHDPIIVLGFFSWTWLPFDLAVIAAILAVIGYSLNDTVVVFDRIREVFEGNKRLPAGEVIDRSINATLSRTIMTSSTTMIVVVCLLLLGGPVLLGFSAALIVGILIGTYSSIYVAGTLALDMGLKAEDLFPRERKDLIDDMP